MFPRQRADPSARCRNGAAQQRPAPPSWRCCCACVRAPSFATCTIAFVWAGWRLPRAKSPGAMAGMHGSALQHAISAHTTLKSRDLGSLSPCRGAVCMRVLCIDGQQTCAVLCHARQLPWLLGVTIGLAKHTAVDSQMRCVQLLPARLPVQCLCGGRALGVLQSAEAHVVSRQQLCTLLT